MERRRRPLLLDGGTLIGQMNKMGHAGEPAVFRWFASGCFCDCYVRGSDVLKLFVSAETTLRRYDSLGIDLGREAWSPAQGDPMGAARVLRARSLDAARRAFESGAKIFALRRASLLEPAKVPYSVLSRSGALCHWLHPTEWLVQGKGVTFRLALKGGIEPSEFASAVLQVDRELAEAGFACKVGNFLDDWGLVGSRPTCFDVGNLESGTPRPQGRFLTSDSFRQLETLHPVAAQVLLRAAGATSALNYGTAAQ